MVYGQEKVLASDYHLGPGLLSRYVSYSPTINRVLTATLGAYKWQNLCIERLANRSYLSQFMNILGIRHVSNSGSCGNSIYIRDGMWLKRIPD